MAKKKEGFIGALMGTANQMGKKISLLAFIVYHLFYIGSAFVDYFTKDIALTESFRIMTSELYPFWLVLAIGVGASGLVQKGSEQLARVFQARNGGRNNGTTTTPITPTNDANTNEP